MRVGCHISIRKGYAEAARTALQLGAGAYQYFPKNPRSLTVKRYDPKDTDACAELCRKHGILSIAHSPYPTNLAADDPKMREANIRSLRNDLEIADACGSVGVVVHFGKYKGRDPLQGYKNIIQCLHGVLVDWEGQAKLLIENQAGEGMSMGTTLEELMQIRNLSEFRNHIAFCFDTCHAYASGLWSTDAGGWKQLSDKAEALGYFEHLRAVHLNDSMYPGGMGKDRHQNIGQGHIGADRFRELLQSSAVRALPLVLETPTPANGSHASEIDYVRTLADS
ncbi:deoxyribonuclease IV [Paenibacillus xerothermodurans]|uniref:Deoxyribonuclease IV n=1 Tax=Paenibacillus xerothermodurans TaxID=1977292 RepID=A0A2W1P254_PAEXE|nr:deoxyribonuclease IV [Paenibacillus xerothermodurans]PZE21822.1 deoxyribonuclease IV [Paenibacillus xerothermodurans]